MPRPSAPAAPAAVHDAAAGLLLDERALVHTLKTLRSLAEEAYQLEVDRAAATPAWVYEGAEALPGQAGRVWRFYAAEAPRAAGAVPTPQTGAGVEVLGERGDEGLASGTVVAANGGALTVQLTRPHEPGRVPPRGRVRLRVDDNQRTLRLQAIERIVRERHQVPWVGPLLAGGPVQPLGEAGWEPSQESELAEGQARALRGATRTRDVFLVQGPPGTGKTTVIASLVRYLVEQRGDRVLLCAQGHRAIDNALDRLTSPGLHALRLGQAAKVSGAGLEALLSTTLAGLAETVRPRHGATQRAVQRAAKRLAEVDELLAQLEQLDEAVGGAEHALGQRLAEIEHAFAARPRVVEAQVAALGTPAGELDSTSGAVTVSQPWARPRAWLARWRGERAAVGRNARARQQELHEDAEERVLRERRAALVRHDLVALREHVQTLREDRVRVALWLTEVAADVRSLLPNVDLPSLDSGDVRRVRAARAAVKMARRRVAHLYVAGCAWSEVVEQDGALDEVVIGSADVVAATTLGVNSGRDGARTAHLLYDVAIVDEAGQAPAMDLVVALSRARTVILVGDHQQLPPYVDDDLLRRCQEQRLDTTWLQQSLFERLWDHLPASHRVRLNLQFRMPAVVADVLGKALYEGDYASVDAKRDMPPVSGLFRAPVVFVDTSDDDGRGEVAKAPGYANPLEAELVAEIVARLPERFREEDGGLGVIAPYAAQVAVLRARLAARLGESPSDGWLQENVATVDSFQGHEREVLLVSLTRSNPRGAVGFVRDLHRLNVTLSRARQQLVVLGDLSSLTASREADVQPFVRFMREFVWHLRTEGEVLTIEEVRRRLANN